MCSQTHCDRDGRLAAKPVVTVPVSLDLSSWQNLPVARALLDSRWLRSVSPQVCSPTKLAANSENELRLIQLPTVPCPMTRRGRRALEFAASEGMIKRPNEASGAGPNGALTLQGRTTAGWPPISQPSGRVSIRPSMSPSSWPCRETSRRSPSGASFGASQVYLCYIQHLLRPWEIAPVLPSSCRSRGHRVQL